MEELARAAEMIRRSRYLVALTGAGISTPSGIPDFRSEGSGLWTIYDPMEVASIWAFSRRPEAFFEWVRPLARMIREARPNPAHYALARLEAAGILKALITQNIDELHQKAGSRRVIEVHGHLREATCIRCYRKVPAAPYLDAFLENGTIPRCEVCGGVLKPNVILFGEQLPAQAFLAAQQEARRADVFLVAGSSLEVAPAGDLPILAKEHGARLILINLSPTAADRYADLQIRGDVAEILPLLVDAVLGPAREEASAAE
ncbi:MAG: NAD-dependent deacylase [Thermoflexus hugenholtzii]|jgi:NAD-dependent deacetylase|uniref:SIR2 family NAD-dependent protein deacylase n=1 Tax=Thermoflexus TaxID=1495649 RepID=UPI001C74714F|nr:MULTISPECIES: NAD-dependent deacylase [Thermoflexus]QWK11082.1 MAG: NAD-dependent deacylase [Thermoflexus hugenholtzii]